MSMDYIRKQYGVPAKRGGKIRYSGKDQPLVGTIVGARNQYLRVRFDGMPHVYTLHPCWCIDYL